MTDKENRRLGGATPEAAKKSDRGMAGSADSIPSQVRRRREAANRCAPMDGKRDPLDRRADFDPAAAYRMKRGAA